MDIKKIVLPVCLDNELSIIDSHGRVIPSVRGGEQFASDVNEIVDALNAPRVQWRKASDIPKESGIYYVITNAGEAHANFSKTEFFILGLVSKGIKVLAWLDGVPKFEGVIE